MVFKHQFSVLNGVSVDCLAAVHGEEKMPSGPLFFFFLQHASIASDSGAFLSPGVRHGAVDHPVSQNSPKEQGRVGRKGKERFGGRRLHHVSGFWLEVMTDQLMLMCRWWKSRTWGNAGNLLSHNILTALERFKRRRPPHWHASASRELLVSWRLR